MEGCVHYSVSRDEQYIYLSTRLVLDKESDLDDSLVLSEIAFPVEAWDSLQEAIRDTIDNTPIE